SRRGAASPLNRWKRSRTSWRKPARDARSSCSPRATAIRPRRPPRSRAPKTRPFRPGRGGGATAAGGACPEMSAVTRLDEWADAPRAIRIVHDIPGRLRLRLPAGASTSGLQGVIDGLNGAQSSVWSPRTRSLLIRYDAGILTPAEIVQAVAEHADADPPASSAHARAEEGRAPVAAAIVETFDGVNERVTRRTRGRLDL